MVVESCRGACRKWRRWLSEVVEVVVGSGQWFLGYLVFGVFGTDIWDILIFGIDIGGGGDDE